MLNAGRRPQELPWLIMRSRAPRILNPLGAHARQHPQTTLHTLPKIDHQKVKAHLLQTTTDHHRRSLVLQHFYLQLSPVLQHVFRSHLLDLL